MIFDKKQLIKFIIKTLSVFFLFVLAWGGSFNIPVYADTLNQQTIFFVNSVYDAHERKTLSATLRKVSRYAYFYVDDQYWNSSSQSQKDVLVSNMEALANEFDNVIYPKETEFFGPEPRPGIDNDPRITILLEELGNGYGGYYDSSNEFLRTQISDSNQREFVVVNAKVESRFSRGFLAHEFQHLISNYQKNVLRKLSEEVWLNELRSEYAVTLTGYNNEFSGSTLRNRVNVFIQNPSDSLTEWGNATADYAQIAMFGEYLADQYGSTIINKTLQSGFSGISSIDNFLSANRIGESFNDIYRNWMVANYLNDRSINPRFGYSRNELKSLKISPRFQASLSGVSSSNFKSSQKNWQPQWFEFNNLSGSDKALKLEVYGNPGQNFVASLILVDGNNRTIVKPLTFKSGKAEAYILNSPEGIVRKATVAATVATKKSDFKTNEPSVDLNVKLSYVDQSVAEESIEEENIGDGALIKKEGGSDLYVLTGKFKRYLSPEVIKMYGHLNPANVVSLDGETFDSYLTSNYVRDTNEEKIYAIWPDNSKHWINISGDQFVSSGRDFNAVFIVNNLEVSFYKTGAAITR